MPRTRRLLTALLALILLFVVAGCSSGGTKTEPREAPEADPSIGLELPPKVLLPQSYVDLETGLGIGYPDGWVATPFEGAVVALVSPQNGEEDIYFENVLLVADDQFQDLTMESYLKALAAEVRNRYPDTETLEEGELEIQGLVGHWMVDRFTSPKGASQVYRAVLIKESTAYVFHGTAPVQTFERYRPIFTAMAESINWQSPGAEPKP